MTIWRASILNVYKIVYTEYKKCVFGPYKIQKNSTESKVDRYTLNFYAVYTRYRYNMILIYR